MDLPKLEAMSPGHSTKRIRAVSQTTASLCLVLLHLTSTSVRVVDVVERAMILLAAVAAGIHLNGHGREAVSGRQGQRATSSIALDAEVDMLLPVLGTVSARLSSRVGASLFSTC